MSQMMGFAADDRVRFYQQGTKFPAESWTIIRRGDGSFTYDTTGKSTMPFSPGTVLLVAYWDGDDHQDGQAEYSLKPVSVSRVAYRYGGRYDVEFAPFVDANEIFAPKGMLDQLAANYDYTGIL